MRTIKFRGQDINTKEWMYGYYFKNHRTNQHVIKLDNDLQNHIEAEVIPETVGQFIGLPDKKGVEMFDGDYIERTGKVT